MTNAELIAKIKVEIEKLKTFYGELHTDFVCEKLLSFLDTLEQEKPVPNDLEEAAVDIADALISKPKDYVLSAKADYWNGAHDGIIAGAKWKKEQMISALKNDGDLPIEFIDKFHEIDRTAFQNGQANMKEQMMKEAVEGKIIFLLNGDVAVNIGDTDEYKLGQKVRIIVKEKENEQSD